MKKIVTLGELEISLDELARFLVEAKRNGWAGNGKENVMPDGSKELAFQKGNFHYTDNYAGSRQFAGTEIVRWQKPERQRIWQMSYFGMLTHYAEGEKTFQTIDAFLKKVLLQVPTNYPFRGPIRRIGYKEQGFRDNEFPSLVYYNDAKLSSSITNFSGREQIIEERNNPTVVFRLQYIGGLIVPK